MMAEQNTGYSMETDARHGARLQNLVSNLRAEVARLQTDLREAQRTSDGLHAAVLMGSREQERLQTALEGAEAQSELRRKALEGYGQHDEDCRRYQREFGSPGISHCDCGLNAAIDITPEQAREKERR